MGCEAIGRGLAIGGVFVAVCTWPGLAWSCCTVLYLAVRAVRYGYGTVPWSWFMKDADALA